MEKPLRNVASISKGDAIAKFGLKGQNWTGIVVKAVKYSHPARKILRIGKRVSTFHTVSKDLL